MSTTTLSGSTQTGAVVHLDMSGLEKLMAEAPARADAVVRKIASKVERDAKQNVLAMRAVDTYALYNSIMTNTSKGSGFSEASAAAKEKNPNVTTTNIPEGELGQAFVGPVVEYGIYVEFGTSRMAGRPFLTRAVENERAKFDEKFAEVFKT